MGEKGYFDDPKWDRRLSEEATRVKVATALDLPRAASWEEIQAALPKTTKGRESLLEKLGYTQNVPEVLQNLF
jgi:hypothetical protein